MPKPPDNARPLLAFAAGWVSATLFSAFMARSVSGAMAIASSAIAIALFLTAGLAYSRFSKTQDAPGRRTGEGEAGSNAGRIDPANPDTSADSEDGSSTERKSNMAAPAPPTLDQRCEAYAHAHGLTPRQGEVLRLLADGLPTTAIADELYLSKDTVKTHTKAIYAKAGVHSRQELLAALYAQDN